MKKLIALAFVLFTAYGCTTIPSASKDSAEGQKALSFEPSEDMGVMYLYRDRNSHFGLFQLDIYIGEHEVVTSPRCFVRVELAPDTYLVEADHPDLFGFEDEIMFEAKAGEIAFYEYKPISRFIVPGSTKIIERSKEDAVATIREQNLCISPVERFGGQ